MLGSLNFMLSMSVWNVSIALVSFTLDVNDLTIRSQASRQRFALIDSEHIELVTCGVMTTLKKNVLLLSISCTLDVDDSFEFSLLLKLVVARRILL